MLSLWKRDASLLGTEKSLHASCRKPYHEAPAVLLEVALQDSGLVAQISTFQHHSLPFSLYASAENDSDSVSLKGPPSKLIQALNMDHLPGIRRSNRAVSFLACCFFFSFKLDATDRAVGAIHECPNPKVRPKNQLLKYLSAHLLHPSRID